MAKLMFVDDSEEVQKLYKRMGRGHETSVHSNPLEAIEQLETGSEPDLIVCDWDMGAHRGDELYNWLKEHNPKLAQRFYFFTGSMSEMKHEMGEVNGFEKPDTTCIRDLIEKLVS